MAQLEFERKLQAAIGRDLETDEDGDVFRGPILRIGIKENVARDTGIPYKMFDIFLGWVAVREGDKWILYKEPAEGKESEGVSSIGGQLEHLTFERNAYGHESIFLPYLGSSAILPVGDNIPKPQV